MTTNTDLELLHRASNDARRAREQAISDRDRIINELVHDFRVETERRIHSEWADRLTDLRAKAHAAELAYEDAKIADALDGGRCKYPIGSKLYEWKSYYYGIRTVPMRATGKVGIVEIITRESKHPDNLSYSRAAVGDVVIRLLTKNGKPGIAYKKFYGWGGWRLSLAARGRRSQHGETRMSLHLQRPVYIAIRDRSPIQLATVEHYRLAHEPAWEGPFDSDLL